MLASNDTMRELLDVPGNRDFRGAIEELARELMRR